MEPIMTLLTCSMNLRLEMTYGMIRKMNIIILQREHTVTRPLMHITNYIKYIRKTVSCHRQELTQRHTSAQWAESERLWHTQSWKGCLHHGPPLEVRDLWGWGGRNIKSHTWWVTPRRLPDTGLRLIWTHRHCGSSWKTCTGSRR